MKSSTGYFNKEMQAILKRGEGKTKNSEKKKETDKNKGKKK